MLVLNMDSLRKLESLTEALDMLQSENRELKQTVGRLEEAIISLSR